MAPTIHLLPAIPVPAQSVGTAWFSIAILSTAMEKNGHLCALCVSSEAGGSFHLFACKAKLGPSARLREK